MRRFPRDSILAVFCVVLTGCGVGTILKSPIDERCQTAGLKGCPELTEGVIAYIEGDNARGLNLVGKAAAANTPEDLRVFADMLGTLESIPGAKQYAGPVFEIAKALREKAAAVESQTASVMPASTQPTAAPAAPKVVTVDFAQLDRRAGQVRPFFEEGRRQCGDLPWSACAPTREGPLVLTDLSLSPACGSSVLVFVTSETNPPQTNRARRTLFGPITGGQWPVEPGDTLVVAVFGKDLADARSHDGCTVSWAGFVPKTPSHGIDDKLPR